jgi:hypothetical protein
VRSVKAAITLQKLHVVQKPLANAQVELVAATGINDAGDLLVTRFTVLRAGRAGATYFQPDKQLLRTRQATVLLVQETGLKKVTLEEARRLVRKAPPVVVTYRQDDRPSPPPSHELWKDLGSPLPDSEAVGLTFARVLRPGTLVFVLSARERSPALTWRRREWIRLRYIRLLTKAAKIARPNPALHQTGHATDVAADFFTALAPACPCVTLAGIRSRLESDKRKARSGGPSISRGLGEEAHPRHLCFSDPPRHAIGFGMMFDARPRPLWERSASCCPLRQTSN